MIINKCVLCAALPVVVSGACLGDFSGAYAPENWTYKPAWPGLLLPLHTADMLTLTGGEVSGDTDILITAAATGIWSFDWSYVSEDSTAGLDAGYYFVNGQSVYLATADIWDQPVTGTVSILVQAGDTIGFRVNSEGGYGPGFLTITDFQAPVPNPAIVAVLGLGLMPARRRRTAASAAPDSAALIH